MEELQREIKKREEAFKKAESDAQELLNEIKNIQKQIENAGGDEFKAQKAKVEKISNAIDEANRTVTKLEVANSSLVQDLEKAVKTKEKNSKEIASTKQETEKKKEELDKIVEVAAELDKEQKNLKELHNQKSVQCKKVLKELEHKRKENSESRGTEVDLQHKLEDVLKILNDDKARAQDYTKKLKKLAQSKSQLAIDENDSSDITYYDAEELSKYTVDDLTTEIAALKQEVSSMPKEYRQRELECVEKQTDLDVTTEKPDSKCKE